MFVQGKRGRPCVMGFCDVFVVYVFESFDFALTVRSSAADCFLCGASGVKGAIKLFL